MLNRILLDELDVLQYILNKEFGKNPYKEIETIASIVKSKNYNQYISINKQIKNIGISLYNRRLNHLESINFHLSLINELVSKIIKEKKNDG